MKRFISSILLLAFLALAGIAGENPIRVLILSGQNNHDWRVTTPVIAKALLETGDCVVTTVNHPEHILHVDLEGVDVIVSDWNTYGGKGADKVTEWSDELKTAYVGFVANGGGHVVVHAGSSSFPGWDDYQQICLATWEIGKTGHGKQHEFEVSVTDAGRAHEITSGMESFKVFDELWHRSKVSEHSNAVPLIEAFSDKANGGSGEMEPLAFVGSYEKGRCFTLMLGHQGGIEGQSLKHPEVLNLLVRGVHWTASTH